MRTTFTLLAIAGAALSQDLLSSLPQCGQTCITNMIAIAQREFGCPTGDAACFCTKVDFGYGIRDCATEACSAEDAPAVIEYGSNYCSSGALSSAVSSGAVPILSSAASVATSAGDEEDASSTPITTSALVGTVTSDGSTYETTTGFSTIYGGATSVLASATDSAGSVITSAASSVAEDASSAMSDASSVASSVASEATDAASSALSEATEAASSAVSEASSALESATDTGNAAMPMMTGFPVAGAAGLAAFLLI